MSAFIWPKRVSSQTTPDTPKEATLESGEFLWMNPINDPRKLMLGHQPDLDKMNFNLPNRKGKDYVWLRQTKSKG